MIAAQVFTQYCIMKCISWSVSLSEILDLTHVNCFPPTFPHPSAFHLSLILEPNDRLYLFPLLPGNSISQ